MLDWIVSKIPDNVWSAGILALGRHFISTAAGGLAIWLLAHHATQDQVTQITEAASSLAMACLSYGLSLWDVKGVDQKITQAQSIQSAPQPSSQPSNIQTSLEPVSTTAQPSLPLFNKVNHPFGDF